MHKISNELNQSLTELITKGIPFSCFRGEKNNQFQLRIVSLTKKRHRCDYYLATGFKNETILHYSAYDIEFYRNAKEYHEIPFKEFWSLYNQYFNK